MAGHIPISVPPASFLLRPGQLCFSPELLALANFYSRDPCRAGWEITGILFLQPVDVCWAEGKPQIKAEGGPDVQADEGVRAEGRARTVI